MISKDTPIWQLTLGQLLEALEANTSQGVPAVDHATDQPRYVYGYKGIASIFGCSVPTAARIKMSGKIDRAIKQVGRKIIVDVDLALELAAGKNGGRK